MRRTKAVCLYDMALESETKLLIAEEDQIIAMKAAVVVGALAVHKVQSNKFVIRRRQLQLKRPVLRPRRGCASAHQESNKFGISNRNGHSSAPSTHINTHFDGKINTGNTGTWRGKKQ